MIPNILSIAGSDPSGGAGIQADIKSISANGGYAMAALTALTAQNTQGVTGIELVPPAFVGQQIDAVFADIEVHAVKIGMIATAEIAEAVADALDRNKASNVVLDPVMVATSGDLLLDDDAVGVAFQVQPDAGLAAGEQLVVGLLLLGLRGAEGGGKVEGLPSHTFISDDGDTDQKCPTEIGITDRREADADAFLSHWGVPSVRSASGPSLPR
mgnify:CR=1 FL=1